MATSNVFLGTEIKLNVSIKPIADLTMDDYDFTIDAYCTISKMVTVSKAQAIRIDESNYVVLIDTAQTGAGRLRCKVKAEIPDEDFDDRLRTEIVVVDTGIEIIKAV